MEYRLLEKTELWIKPVGLSCADLGACARAAAETFGLKPHEIMVTDAMGDTLTLDILVPTMCAEQILGRRELLLDALSRVPGVEIFEETDIHSDGVLGLISLDKEFQQEVMERSSQMVAEIYERIRKRSMVCATGDEVLRREILDTNTPFLVKSLEEEGFTVASGPVLGDHAASIARAFQEAAEGGYGLLITTGGIGAEGKDQTLEALGQVDPEARMPYILKFEKGSGRHHRDGVRIGVGILEPTLITCLPGPHDEVELAWPVLKEGLKESWDKATLAEALARVLRNKFLSRSSMNNHCST